MVAHRFFVSLVTVVAFTAAQVPMAAFAQNSAQAEVLFKEGQQLMADKKYDAACQRLTASFKLDPQPNTELLQGLCFSKLGKTASAYNAFIDASSTLPRGGDAQKYAADQAKALESQLLKVKVTMQPVVPPGVAFRFDDETKTRDKDFADLDIALDPGDHDIFVTAPNKHDYTKHFKLSPGESVHAIIVNMIDKTQAELDAEKAKGGGGGQVIIEKPDVSWSAVKTVGLVTIIVGGAVLIGSGVSFILTQVDQSNAVTLQGRSGAGCVTLSPPAPPATNPNSTDANCTQAVSYHQQALATQTAAIALLVGGAVVGVIGVIMFVVGGNVTKAPEKPPAATWHVIPMLSPNMAGAGLIGTF